MKDQMREDLLITRKDILIHMSARPADRANEEDVPSDAYTRLLFRLFGGRD